MANSGIATADHVSVATTRVHIELRHGQAHTCVRPSGALGRFVAARRDNTVKADATVSGHIEQAADRRAPARMRIAIAAVCTDNGDRRADARRHAPNARRHAPDAE